MTDSRSVPLDPALLLATLVASCAPTLLAYNRPPSATALNQCLAVALWGVVAAMNFTAVEAPAKHWRQVGPLLGALGLIAAAALGSWGFGALPLSLALQGAGLMAGAALMVASGASASRNRGRSAAFGALALGLLIAGLASSAIGLVQVFAPAWLDGNWIAQSAYIGRAVGNLRQPNHLCTLLQWSLVGAVALHELRWLPRAALWLVALVLVWVVQLSASRTGAVGLLLFLGWALLDRRLSRSARWVLGSTPLLYAFAFVGMTWFDRVSQHGPGDRIKLAVAADGTLNVGDVTQRLRIWRDAVDLISAQPWTGVGFGEFNFAWTLSSIADRTSLIFDNCHNLILQLAVELGVPGAVLVVGLLLFALWQGLQRARMADEVPGLIASAGSMIVLVVGLHSMVEFPLWYAYFLLPAALAWGFVLGAPLPTPKATTEAAGQSIKSQSATWGLIAGLLMSVAGAWSLLDYQRVILIYAGRYSDAERKVRVEAGQQSVFFAHQADYTAALAPGSSQPSRDLGFKRGIHTILDKNMLLAWAKYLAGKGQIDQAQWVLQRMREFRGPEVDAYFAPCLDRASMAFQCQMPTATHDWREFLSSSHP
jgi:O-antigen ligase